MFERKTDYGNKAGECNCHGLCGRDAKILYRLCHERYHFQGTSGCAGRPEAGTEKNPV